MTLLRGTKTPIHSQEITDEAIITRIWIVLGTEKDPHRVILLVNYLYLMTKSVPSHIYRVVIMELEEFEYCLLNRQVICGHVTDAAT